MTTTQTISRLSQKYTDIDLDFIVHPVTKDLAKKTGNEAVKRSVRNLVLTHFYERPFRSYIGSGAHKLLFENINEDAYARLLAEKVNEVITNFEPRATVLAVTVDTEIDNNAVAVEILFRIENLPDPLTTTVFLRRVR